MIDTGYQGFVALPRPVFKALSMYEMTVRKRTVLLADGTKISTESVEGTAVVIGLDAELDGAFETLPGLSEILVGTEFLSRFRLSLDYCLRTTSLDSCR